MTQFSNFLTKVSFWGSSVSLYSPDGILQFKTSKALHFFSNRITRIYRGTDTKTPWLEVRNMAGRTWRDMQYEILENGNLIASIYIDVRTTPAGEQFMKIRDSDGQEIGAILDNNSTLRGLSALTLGSFTVIDAKQQVIGTVEHKNHDAKVKLVKSSDYLVNSTRELEGIWEAVLVEVSVLAALGQLRYSGTSHSL